MKGKRSELPINPANNNDAPAGTPPALSIEVKNEETPQVEATQQPVASDANKVGNPGPAETVSEAPPVVNDGTAECEARSARVLNDGSVDLGSGDESDIDGEAYDILHSSRYFEPKVNSIASDGAKSIVSFTKSHGKLADAWRKMTEAEQEAIIDWSSRFMTRHTTDCVNVVASRGFVYVEMDITKVTVTLKEDGRKVEFAGAIAYDEEFVRATIENKSIMACARKMVQFFGGDRPKTDKIPGELGLPQPELPLQPPTSGPGTPTHPAVMDAVGKGPEAAKEAAATVVTDPQPNVPKVDDPPVPMRADEEPPPGMDRAEWHKELQADGKAADAAIKDAAAKLAAEKQPAT